MLWERFLGHLDRKVGDRERQVEEKPIIAMLADDFHGFFCQAVRQVFAHGAIELDVIDRGLPFFVEKPVARHMETALEILAAVEAAGLITAYHPPGGPGVRLDTHVYAGYSVPPYYDSLLAKVIVHGNTRDEALRRMGQALDSFILEGVTTTIPFLARVIRHPAFVAGQVDTRFLERESHLLRPEA
jgi:hypothetical protein